MKRRRKDPRCEALAILARVEAGAWSHRLLNSVQARLPEEGDRRFVHHLVLETLRWQGALDHVVSPHVRGSFADLDPLVRAGLRVGVLQALRMGRPVPIAVASSVDAVKASGAGRAASLVNAVLRKAFREAIPTLDPLLTVPCWLRRRWEQSFGRERAGEIVGACLRPAPRSIIVRPDGPSRAEVAERLLEGGVEVALSRIHPLGLEIVRGSAHAESAEGAGRSWLMMDAASALVAYLTRPTIDGPVVDLAGAPGGKAALTAMLWSKPVLAGEKNRARAERMAQRLGEMRALPASGRAAVMIADATAAPLRESMAGVVLLDAPCSGTGTLRRRPEIRHRLTLDEIDRCSRDQERMLDAASSLVRPGGVLVYSVCSIEAEEGHEQVEGFLSRHADFEIEDPRPLLPREARALVSAGLPLLRTTPGEEGLDGFVAARLRRV